ncbi:MAG: phosphorylase [Candidatus Rokubacteria bacterium]|nr:phosphorylase [Candidatus Rokubacteria bacterium]
MKGVLVLTAIDVEARGLARHLGVARVEASDWPHYRGGVLEVMSVGLRGSALDARAGVARRPSLVVSAGTCGALDPDLAEGDVVVPEVVLTEEGPRAPTDPLPGLARVGALLTLRGMADTPARKARLWMETGALAVDLESAIILEWARARGLPAAVVRGVSDSAGRALPADLAAVVDPDGRVRTSRAVRAALARPRALGDALALRRGTSAALANVAAALARIARAARASV